jgi:hypothetical protein
MWNKQSQTARQPTDDDIIRRMCFVCWITKTTVTHSDYIILIDFHSLNGYTNALQCEVYTYIACLIDTQVRETQIPRRNKCVFEPKQFRHINIVQDFTTILKFYYISIPGRNCFGFQSIPLRSVLENSCPGQFSVVHFQELLCLYNYQIFGSKITRDRSYTLASMACGRPSI